MHERASRFGASWGPVAESRRALRAGGPGGAVRADVTPLAERGRRRGRVAAGAAVVLLALGGAPEAAPAQELPPGVTDEMVRQGRDLFESDGFCYTCHGRDGSGMQGAGGDLTDGEWRHTDASFEGLTARIRDGVRANASSTGVPMPPAGGAELTPEQLRAVAAYVWTLGPNGG